MLETKGVDDDRPMGDTEGITLQVIRLNEQTLELEPALSVPLADAPLRRNGRLERVCESTFPVHP